MWVTSSGSLLPICLCTVPGVDFFNLYILYFVDKGCHHMVGTQDWNLCLIFFTICLG